MGDPKVLANKMTLVLHIEVPEFYAEDAQESADEFYHGDVGRLVIAEWLREEVGLTLVSLPGEKCLNGDFTVMAFTGRIVGAEVKGGR